MTSSQSYARVSTDDRNATELASVRQRSPPHNSSSKRRFFYADNTDPIPVKEVRFLGRVEKPEGNTSYAQIESASSFKFEADCGDQPVGFYTVRWRMSLRKGFVIPNGLHFVATVSYEDEADDASGSMEVVMTHESLLTMANITGDCGRGRGGSDSESSRTLVATQRQQDLSLSWCDVELKETLTIHPHSGTARVKLVLSNIKDLESDSVEFSGLAIHHAEMMPKAEMTDTSRNEAGVPVHPVFRSHEPDYVIEAPLLKGSLSQSSDSPPKFHIIRIACSSDGRFLASLALSGNALYLQAIDNVNRTYAVKKLLGPTNLAIGLSISEYGDLIAVYQEPSIGDWKEGSEIPKQLFPFQLFDHSLLVSGSHSRSSSVAASTLEASPHNSSTLSTNSLRHCEGSLTDMQNRIGTYLKEFVGYGAFFRDIGNKNWELNDFNPIPVVDGNKREGEEKLREKEEGDNRIHLTKKELHKTMFAGCDGLCLYVFDASEDLPEQRWQHKYTVILDKLTHTLSRRITCKMMMNLIGSNTFIWLEAGGVACTIWNLHTGSNITHITGTNKTKFGGQSFRNNSKISISPNESIVALVSLDGILTTFFTSTGIPISECNFPGYRIEHVEFTHVEDSEDVAEVAELLVVLRHNASFALETRILDPLQLKSQTICSRMPHENQNEAIIEDLVVQDGTIDQNVDAARRNLSMDGHNVHISGPSSMSTSVSLRSRTKEKVTIQLPVPTIGTTILGSFKDKEFGKSRHAIFEVNEGVINCYFLAPPSTSQAAQDPSNAQNTAPGQVNTHLPTSVQLNPLQAALSPTNPHPDPSPGSPTICPFTYITTLCTSKLKDNKQGCEIEYQLRFGQKRRELLPDGEGAQYWVQSIEVFEEDKTKNLPLKCIFSFVPEPWTHTLTTDIADPKTLLSMTFLGEHGRFAVLGQQTIQIWTVPTSEDSKCSLLYIWSRPNEMRDPSGTDDGDLEKQYEKLRMTIHSTEDGAFTVWREKPAEFLVQIPGQLGNGSKSAFSDCLKSIHLLAAAYTFSHQERKKAAKDSEATLMFEDHAAAIVRFTLEHLNRVSVSKVVKGNTVDASQIVVDTILTALLGKIQPRDSISNIFVEGLLESANGKWVPRTYRTLNPLKRVIDARNGQLLDAFVKYCIHSAKTRHPAYMIPAVQCVKELSKWHPDVLRDMFKEASYIPAHNQDYVIAQAKIFSIFYKPWRINSWFIKSNNINKYKKPIFCLLSQLRVKKPMPKSLGATGAALGMSQAVGPILDIFPAARAADKLETKAAKYSHTVYVSPFPKFSSHGHRITSSSRPVESPFMSLAGKDFFESPAMEAILTFKWEKFGFLMWSIQFFVSFFLFTTIVALTGIQIYLCSPPTPIRPPNDEEVRARYMEHMRPLFWVVIGFAAFILLFDVRRALSAPLKYMRSPYWVIRMVANGLTLTGFAMFTTKHVGDLDEITHTDRGPSQISWISFAVLAYYLNFLFELRAVESLGTVVNIMIKIAKRIVWFAIVFVLFLVGFTHALLHLLHTRKYDDCKTDDPTRPCAPEDFPDTYPSRFFPALSSTYFFLAGRYDPVNNALDSVVPSVHVMMCIFYTFTAILFLNILIAVMNDAFNDTTKQGQIARLEQWSEIIAEAESIFLNNSRLMNSNYFPDYVFYGGNERDAERHQSAYSISNKSNLSVENRFVVDTVSDEHDTYHTTQRSIQRDVQELEATVSKLEAQVSDISQDMKTMTDLLKSVLGNPHSNLVTAVQEYPPLHGQVGASSSVQAGSISINTAS
ncbi:hypothetical protein BGZ99_005301 [Dissophora globulifera]|uniref:Ion transport domain-containing protein n=1 Tax=Dissophora globulifera TaxID=979702 RepID=A0A9P6RTH8_9FUNG|nr:hypothetical protein BGZ99_005301 [Dissophora globulifera]